MWNEAYRNQEDGEEAIGRSSTSSEVMVVNDMALDAVAGVPAVSNLNITRSSRVHIGPKFVSVTQNVSNTEVVKELPLPQYLWNIARNTTRAEKVSCTVAMAALLLCTSLIIYFTAAANKSAITVVDKAPHEWNITREMWLATPYNFTRIDEQYKPLKLVVVQHSVSTECHRFVLCAAELRTMEHYFLSLNSGLNLPYNFIIGNEARVYEAVGWDFIGTHTLGFNRCSLGVGFIGDYRLEKNLHTKVTTKQLERFQMLLDAGVEYGYLDPNYRIVGAKDVTPTVSPGSGLYAALTAMDHFDSKHMFNGKTCDEIRDMHLPTKY